MLKENGFYNEDELQNLGFKTIGKNVLLSRKCSIYGAARIEIGDNVRIDDFCILSAGNGGIKLGNYIHVAVYSAMIGAGRIVLNDYCNISSKVAIYSSNDDYSGEFMTNPTVPSQYTNVTHGEVFLEKHVLIGSGSIILPNVTLFEGAVVGGLSLVSKDCEAFTIYAGVPAKKIRDRKKNLLELEKEFIQTLKVEMS